MSVSSFRFKLVMLECFVWQQEMAVATNCEWEQESQGGGGAGGGLIVAVSLSRGKSLQHTTGRHCTCAEWNSQTTVETQASYHRPSLAVEMQGSVSMLLKRNAYLGCSSLPQYHGRQWS